MKKLILITLLIAFTLQSGFSQIENQMNLDSVFRQIENISNDTLKLKRYFELYNDYQLVLSEKIHSVLKNKLDYALSENNKLNEAYCYFLFGKIAINNDNFSQALSYFLQSNDISNQHAHKDLSRNNYYHISVCYEKLNNFRLAYKNYLLYNALADSIIIARNNQLKDRFIRKIEINNLIMLRNLGKDILERKKSELTSKILEGILAVLIIALIIISLYHKYNAKKIIKIKNKEIETQRSVFEQYKDELFTQQTNLECINKALKQQKHQLEAIHRQTTDSIMYASRIQNAMMPKKDLIEMLLPQHFILFRPRDVVSGDFYFIKQVKNFTFVVVGDCTGHGVPGAFMSMLGIALINELIRRDDIVKANQALEEMRKYIKNALQQTGKYGEQRDGIDVAFCAIDIETNQMSYAGAYNPLIIMRNGEMIEYKPDRMPVGIYYKEYPFTEHKIQLYDNDIFYLFSDGYYSQIGWQNETFKSTRFKKLLLDIHKKPMPEQKQILETTYNNWRGDFVMMDDVLVLGVKI